MLEDKLTTFEADLGAHDKKYAADNSIKNIAELTATFADLDSKVKDVESRIVEGVIDLQHEIASRELQLEKLVAEQNELLAKRRIARSRCSELTIRNA